ncbi:hypothetical protein K469DRAFT_716555 [Zopfia rhizophila CBS 207.26]|uniref:Uncharacterized protein n=1 Tax=Zopfia rhizophila CBS 207.26 TaxID=1314779 RepID=A0A6A6DNS1_9PEZI|nr:hypothetical protein K469DRAFT_716555 [Zopfia rhizophila CBS 207.26]
MGKLSTLEMRVDPKATATGNDYTLIPKSLKCAATHYPDNVIREDYTIKKLRIQARHDKKLFLEHSHLKVLTHCDHADTLGKALNTAETKLNEARDELAELQNEIKILRVQIKKPTHNIYFFLSVKASLALLSTPVKKTRFTALLQTPQNQAGYVAVGPDNASPYLPATPLATLTVGSHQGNSRSARFPDPPMLKDGKDENIVSYMRTRTEGPANQYLLTLIRIIRESKQLVSYQYIVDCLERTYGDPHKRLNAHRDFQKLYLRDPTNFTVF